MSQLFKLKQGGGEGADDCTMRQSVAAMSCSLAEHTMLVQMMLVVVAFTLTQRCSSQCLQPLHRRQWDKQRWAHKYVKGN